MSDPFRFCSDDENGIVSFSGGRTSGYLLHRVVQAYGGLPANVKAIFCNTGLEMPQTLDFVEECSSRWGVPIVWLEHHPDKPGFQVVNHATASRNGEPFRRLMETPILRRDGTVGRRPLPNPVTRVCTRELKIRLLKRFSKRHLGWKKYTSAVGIRADEAHRAVSKFPEPGESKVYPLHAAGITKPMVLEFWSRQTFDLRLPIDKNGDTVEGNCDLCFMKSAKKVSALVARYPERAEWWAQMEERSLGTDRASTFRQDRPTYRELIDAAKRGDPMDFGIFDDLTGCASHGCTD